MSCTFETNPGPSWDNRNYYLLYYQLTPDSYRFDLLFSKAMHDSATSRRLMFAEDLQTYIY